MRDDAVSGAALVRRNIPLRRGSGDQHHSRGGSALAHILVRLANAPATAGREVAPDALAGDIFAWGRIVGCDLRPVAFELFCDELGEAGQRPLAHLRAGNADHHRIVLLYYDPGVDFGWRVIRQRLRRSPRDMEAERQSAADRGCAGEKRTAREFWRVGHRSLPHASVAA